MEREREKKVLYWRHGKRVGEAGFEGWGKMKRALSKKLNRIGKAFTASIMEEGRRQQKSVRGERVLRGKGVF